MATTTDRRGGEQLTDVLHRLSRRERIAVLALAGVLLLTLAVGVGSAIGGGVPFVGDDEETRGASGVPSDWSGLEPLLPLAPSLKDIAALKSTAAGGASGVLAAESGAGGGGAALRVRALPDAAGAATGGRARVAAARAPSGRPRPAAVGAPERTMVRVPLVRRILATRLQIDLGVTNSLRKIIEEDLRNLTGLPIDLSLGSLTGLRIDLSLGSLTGIGAGGPLTLTVVDSQSDSRFDILLVARGGRLIEAYRFRDRDIAGLAAQINLRSRVMVADLLRDGKRLARVTAAPLRSDPAGPASGSLAAGLTAGASRDGTGIGGTGIGAGPDSLAAARSGAKGRPRSGRRGRGSGGRSAGGGGSSPSFSRGSSSSSGSGKSTPRRSTAPRRSTPARPPRSSPSPRPTTPERQRGGGHPNLSRPRRGGGSSGHGNRRSKGHDKGRGKGHDKGRGKGHDE